MAKLTEGQLHASDEILAQKVTELDKLQLKGSDVINEFASLMKEWDPRIVSQAVSSVGRWRDWIASDQQQQQQQQQHGR